MICLSDFQDSVTAVLPAVFVIFDRTPLVSVNDGSLALYQALLKPRAMICIIDQFAPRDNVFKPTYRYMTKSNTEPHFEASICPRKPLQSRVIDRLFEREAHAKIYRQHHHVAFCIA